MLSCIKKLPELAHTDGNNMKNILSFIYLVFIINLLSCGSYAGVLSGNGNSNSVPIFLDSKTLTGSSISVINGVLTGNGSGLTGVPVNVNSITNILFTNTPVLSFSSSFPFISTNYDAYGAAANALATGNALSASGLIDPNGSITFISTVGSARIRNTTGHSYFVGDSTSTRLSGPNSAANLSVFDASIYIATNTIFNAPIIFTNASGAGGVIEADSGDLSFSILDALGAQRINISPGNDSGGGGLLYLNDTNGNNWIQQLNGNGGVGFGNGKGGTSATVDTNGNFSGHAAAATNLLGTIPASQVIGVVTNLNVLPFGLPNPYAWYSATVFSNYINGQSISTWTDISGNGNTLVGGHLVTYSDTGVGGRPAAWFSGNSWLTNANFWTASLNTNFTIVIVYLVSQPSWGQNMLLSSGTASQTYMCFIPYNGSATLDQGPVFSAFNNSQQIDCVSDDVSPAQGYAQIVSLTFSNYYKMYVNGVCGNDESIYSGATYSGQPFAATNLVVGSNPGLGGGYSLYGGVSEIIVFSNALTQSQIFLLNNYEKSLTGLAGNSIFLDGPSTIAGYNTTHYQSPASWLHNSFPQWRVQTPARYGFTTLNQITNQANWLNTKTAAEKIYIPLLGCNDFVGMNTAQATTQLPLTETNYATICSNAYAAGYTVLAMTQPSEYVETNGYRTNLNTWISQNYSNIHCSGLIDVSQNPNYGLPGTYTNTIYINTDQLHPTGFGWSNIVANYMTPAISQLLAGSSFSGTFTGNGAGLTNLNAKQVLATMIGTNTFANIGSQTNTPFIYGASTNDAGTVYANPTIRLKAYGGATNLIDADLTVGNISSSSGSLVFTNANSNGSSLTLGTASAPVLLSRNSSSGSFEIGLNGDISVSLGSHGGNRGALFDGFRNDIYGSSWFTWEAPNSTNSNAGNLWQQGTITAAGGVASSAVHTPVAVTVGGSPFSFTNTTPIALECYFDGGTAYSVSKNGVAIYSSMVGDKSFVLQKNSIAIITYTIAPAFYTNAW